MEPRDPRFAEVVRESFARQAVMELFGASLVRVEPGAIDIELPFRAELTQQSGSLHAGVITAIADSACGYAALSLMEPGSEVLSVEFKVNLLRPGLGERFVAEGRVVRPGATITVTKADVYAVSSRPTLIATMLGTMIRRPGARSGAAT
jgi:uncharacterized protein (TIGR00369 family)